MSLSADEKARCEAWCKAHARKWQIYNRSQWKYEFHGKVLVRFVDEVQMREDEMRLLLEFLASDDCIATLCVYDQSLEATWKPIKAWYEITTRATGAVHAVRLYHGLNTDPESSADGPYTMENGCAYKVTFTYYWKQPTVITLPTSSSGVNYRISNLSRDDEDGAYSYVLEKRERVQQDVPLYLHETDLLRDVSHEEHLGVKAGVSAGQEASCDNAGTKVTKTIRKNEDCTGDILNDVTKDKPMTAKVTEVQVGIHGTSQTVTDVNVSEPKPTTGLAVGQTVRNEKTETGLWNTTVRNIVASFVGWIRKGCRKTIFRHTHTQTNAQGTDPGFTHTTDASGGVIHDVSVEKTEFGYDVTDTTHTDMPVQNAVVVTEKRIGGVVKTTVNRAQSADAPTAGLAIGGSVRNEKTESGLVDQTITEVVAQDVGTVDESCDKTAHAHTHSTTEVVGTDPGAVDAESVSDGTVHSRRVQRTESGAFRVTDETKKALPTAVTSTSGTVSQTSVQTNYRNVNAVDGSGADVNVSVETSSARNDAGLVDGTRRVTTFTPEQRTVSAGNAFYDEVTTVKEHEATEQEPSRPFSTGTIYGLSSNPNGVGSATVSVTKRSAKPQLEHLDWVSNSNSGSTVATHRNRITWFKNQTEPPEIDTSWESCSPSFSMNEFGLFDGVYHYSTLVSYSTTSGSAQAEQYDMSSWIPVEPVKYVKRRGVLYKVYPKGLRCRKRVLVSTKRNMLQEIVEHPGYPQYGLVSKMGSAGKKGKEDDNGGGFATIYQELEGGHPEVWEKVVR